MKDEAYLKTMGLHDDLFPLIRRCRKDIVGTWAGSVRWARKGDMVRARKEKGGPFTIRRLKLGKHAMNLTDVVCGLPARFLAISPTPRTKK